MFEKGDTIRVTGDDDDELFIVIRTNSRVIYEYNVMGKPKWKVDNTRMVVKPINNPNYPGLVVLDKHKCEHFMTRKDIKPFSFLD